MCSIAGMIELSGNRIPGLAHKLNVMNDLQAHRGPDGHGVWMHQAENVGMAHRRLSIIDIASGQQPMTDHHGNWVSTGRSTTISNSNNSWAAPMRPPATRK